MTAINISKQQLKTLFRETIEVIRGADKDFTKGHLGKAIFLLSIPMVLEMLMESIFAVADIFFVSKLGASAIATVGITESLITIVYAFGIGISTATTALVARRTGEKDERSAAKSAVHAIYVGAFISLIIAVFGVAYYKELLQLMGLHSPEHAMYAAIMLGGNIFIMLLFIINAIFRSAGDAAVSMRVLVLANGLNIILDPILIFGLGPFPELGVMGAAIATTTGRGIAVVYQFYLLFNGNYRVKPVWDDLKLDVELIVKVFRLSGGGILQYIIATSSWIGLMRILAEFGDNVVAGYTIAIRIVIFSLLPSWGISNAAATLVGQNLGAKQTRRAEQSAWFTGKVNSIWMGLLSIVLIAWAEQWVSFFTDDPNILRYGTESLQVLSLGFLFYGLGMVMVNSLNGAGDTYTPTWINILCFWMVEIPVAYLLAMRWGWNETGVFYSIIIAETLMTIVSVWVFKRGAWKEKMI